MHDQRNASATKPFFCYLALGACHSPLHVPAEWRDRFRGAFDAGWDAWREATHARQIEMGLLPPGTALTPRPDWVKPWDALTDDERAVATRSMETFAGFLAHADHHVGRLVEELRAMGELDNTIVVVLSDNGASAEGGPLGSVNANLFYNQVAAPTELNLRHLDAYGDPTTNPHYPYGWALAGNTPFQRWKRETHEGGIADPLIVSWSGIPAEERGQVRHHYTHVIDLMPTILELAGVTMPTHIDGIEQVPLAGASMSAALRTADAPEHRTTQHYEQFGCRAIYHEGWKAVAYHPLAGLANYSLQDPFRSYDDDPWELYHVAVDPSETTDLAASHPEKLRELQELWWQQAERYDALRCTASGRRSRSGPASARRRSATSTAGLVPAAAPVRGQHARACAHDHRALRGRGRRRRRAAGRRRPLRRLRALRRRRAPALREHDLRARHDRRVVVRAGAARPAGRPRCELPADRRRARRDAVDRRRRRRDRHDPAPPRAGFSLAGDGLSCGFDAGSPVGPYESPFIFSGTLDHVAVDVSGAPQVDAAAMLARILKEQ